MKTEYSHICQNTGWPFPPKPVRWILQVKINGVWFNQDFQWDSERDATEAGVMMANTGKVEKYSVKPA